MWLDVTSLQAEQISEVQLVNFDVGAPLAARNVLNCFLEPAGLSYVIESDVVKINNFLVGIEGNMAAFREVRDRYLNTKAPPASTTIGVPALARPGGLFEIEAIAVVGGSAAAAKSKPAKKTKKKRR